jgi:hypothetical protein
MTDPPSSDNDIPLHEDQQQFLYRARAAPPHVTEQHSDPTPSNTVSTTTSVDELMFMNLNWLATPTESTSSKTTEDQLLPMVSSHRRGTTASSSSPYVYDEPPVLPSLEKRRGIAAALDDTTSTKPAHDRTLAPFSIQLSSQRGESISAMSASSVIDDSGHDRQVTPTTNNIDGHKHTHGHGHGPPRNIIEEQPPDDTDLSFIKLDSMKGEGEEESERMSEVSDFQYISTSINDGNNHHLLNMDSSSSTSMGSQGSYAYQVPALSQSTSASHGTGKPQTQIRPWNKPSLQPSSPAKGQIDLPSERITLVPRTGQGLMMMNPPSGPTLLPIDVGNAPHNSDLDDILGPRGEPLQSDLDDILGPHDGKPSDLDDTLGPYQGENPKETPHVASSDSAPGLLTNYASKYTMQLPDTMLSNYVLLSPKGYEEPSPTSTPAGSEPGTPTNHTPSMSRRAIDHIGKALAERSAEQNVLATIATAASSTLADPSFVGSTVYGTAMDNHTPRHSESMQSSMSTKNQPHRQFITRKTKSVDSVQPTTTWESRNAVPMSRATSRGDDDTSVHEGDTLSPDDLSSYWESSRNDTLSPGASSRGETLSPGVSDTLSPSSPSTRGSQVLIAQYSQDETYASSRRDAFSPHDDSTRGESLTSQAASSKSDSQSQEYSSHGDCSQTEHTHEYSFTNHAQTVDSSRGGSYSRGERFSPSASEYTQESGRYTFESEEGSSRPTIHLEAPDFSQTTSGETGFTGQIPSAATDAFSTDVSVDSSVENGGGGDRRMRDVVQVEAKSERNKPLSPQGPKFAESIMARTRSRADPDALVENSTNSVGDVMEIPTRSMIKLATDEDVGILENTALARKRVRVVQLLGAGLTTFLISFMGGFWIQSSCHFVSKNVEVGEYNKVFSLHFGLWKYTPIESIFQGYAYCSAYDEDYVNDGPWFARLTSNLALIGGAFSLLVLWVYLVFGRFDHRVWKGAVLTAGLSGGLQLLTLSIFAGPVCASGCTLGPGGYVSLLASCFYLFLAHEMYYNAPLSTVADGLLTTTPNWEQPQNLMAELEMKDFKHGAKAYVRRLTHAEANPCPTVNLVRREHRSSKGEQKTGRERSKSGSYQAPPVFV